MADKPFEVRFFDQNPPVPRQPVEPQPAIAVNASIGPEIDTLLSAMIDADEIWIIGTMPWECTKRLIEHQIKRSETNDKPPAKTVHYFTRTPYRGHSEDTTLAGGVQRWIAGISGLRNWLTPGRHEASHRDRLKIYETPADDGGCLVLIRKGTRFAARDLRYLIPTLRSVDTRLIISASPDQAIPEIRAHVQHLVDTCKPWEGRHVLCAGPEDASTTFTGQVCRISHARHLEESETEPAAAVAVCARSGAGDVVLLKLREPHNAIDDHNRLSLVSERLIVTDLADWLPEHGLDPDDDQKAFDQLFKGAGWPPQLVLNQKPFVVAAQRELFLSCGLNVDQARLRFCGYRLVVRQDKDEPLTYLGFAVFRLDLIQRNDVDELKIVEDWNPAMKRVLVKSLYGSGYQTRLNRLLVNERKWLMDNVLQQPAPTASIPSQRP